MSEVDNQQNTRKPIDNYDLFGEKVEKNAILRDIYIEPPFSILDTKQGRWQNRKNKWLNLGIESELGRDDKLLEIVKDGKFAGKEFKNLKGTSIFDPALCEVLYRWFCPSGGEILDPFAGGSVRGIVANYLGFKYTGIEIRGEQVKSNREQAGRILSTDNQPCYYIGDSNIILDKLLDSEIEKYDFVFSCPPYVDLEVYSKLQGELSNMDYSNFLVAYKSIIKKSCKLLKNGGLACFVVGEVRNKKGNYYGFVPDTIKIFQEIGMNYYNEAILLNAIGTAMMRVGNCMKNKKLVKIHQNILVFRKED